MKMKGNGMRAVPVMVMVLALALLATTASASFTQCYAQCYSSCFTTKHTPIQCGITCTKQCISTPPNDHLYPCTLGCAYSNCSNISTKQNPGAEEVEACVNGCSQTCSKKH
uniref:Thionin-like protein 2 n=1 Tax=Nelumbo nucifera TaxID=4432 RepID=A0A822ZP85_NELNU|nr:TPA_asm: hypothetical protein HUJ06_002966 [Nelumbo nucifera]